jgi:hypothetical protein
MKQFRLSKSKIAAFEHCPKRLWLQVHRRELARINEQTLAVFRAGHLVGDFARLAFPDGKLVLAEPNPEAALQQTSELLNSGWDRPIFEGTFLHQDVLIRADVLRPDGQGGWSLVEVKNSRRVSSYQIYDVATQAWTALGAGVRISSFAVRHVHNVVRDEADLAHCTFIDTDITWRVLGLASRRLDVIAAARACVRGPEPQRPPGPYCTRPFVCEFRDYCNGVISEIDR